MHTLEKIFNEPCEQATIFWAFWVSCVSCKFSPSIYKQIYFNFNVWTWKSKKCPLRFMFWNCYGHHFVAQLLSSVEWQQQQRQKTLYTCMSGHMAVVGECRNIWNIWNYYKPSKLQQLKVFFLLMPSNQNWIRKKIPKCKRHFFAVTRTFKINFGIAHIYFGFYMLQSMISALWSLHNFLCPFWRFFSPCSFVEVSCMHCVIKWFSS